MSIEGEPRSREEELTFRERLIALRTMEPRLRALTLAMIAQVLAGVLLLCLRQVRLWPIEVEFGDVVLEIGGINYLLAYLSAILALTLGVVGLAGANSRGAWAFFGILSTIYVVGIVGIFSDPLTKLDIVFGIFLWTALAAFAPKGYRQAYSPERQHKAFIWGVMIAGVGLPALLFLVAVPAFVEGLILIRIPLVYLFVLAGTDWAEIDDSLIRRMVERLRSPASERRLVLATAGLAALIAAGTIALAGPAILNRVIPLTGCFLVLLAVLRLARFPGEWSTELPWGALALLVVAFNLILDVAGANGMTPQTNMYLVLVPLAALLAGGLVYVARTPGYANYCSTLLFGVVLSLVALGSLLPIPLFEQDAAAPILSVFFYVAVATLAVLAWWKIDGRSWAARRDLLALLCILNGGFAGLYLIWAVLYEWVRGAAESSDLIAGLVVFVALLWDILISGHSVTNVDGKYFPRRSRLYLFFAFVAFAVATIVFWGSLRAAPGQSAGEVLAVSSMYADTEGLVERGIGLLGPPLLLTFFIIRLGSRRRATMFSRHNDELSAPRTNG